MTTFRSVCDAPGRVRAASGVGVEDTTRAGRQGSASGPCPLDLPTSPGACELAIENIRRARRHRRAAAQEEGPAGRAADAKERIKVLRAGMETPYFGPSPGPKSSGLLLGCNFPDSLSESNISSALRMAWSMLKYL